MRAFLNQSIFRPSSPPIEAEIPFKDVELGDPLPPEPTPDAPDVAISAAQVIFKEDSSATFDVSVASQGDDVVDEVTLSGLWSLEAVAGWSVGLSDNGAGGSFTIVDETYIYAGDGDDAAVILRVTLTPPVDSDKDVATEIGFDLRVSATSRDGAVISAPSPEHIIDIDIDAVLDQYGDVAGTDQTVLESVTEQSINLGLTLSLADVGHPGQDPGADADGSEGLLVLLELYGVLPAGVVLASTAGTVTQVAGSTYRIEGADLEAAVTGLQAIVPATVDGQISGRIVALALEENTPPITPFGIVSDADMEHDITDNIIVDSALFSLTIDAGAITPEVTVPTDTIVGKEDGTAAFDVTVTSPAGDVVNTVTLLQLGALEDLGWGVTLSDNLAGGAFTRAGDDYLYTADGIDEAVVLAVELTPPADSDKDVVSDLGVDIGVSATSRDGVVISEPSAVQRIDIDVDAVLDQVAAVSGADQTVDLPPPAPFTVFSDNPLRGEVEPFTTNLGLTLALSDSGFPGQAAGADSDGSESMRVFLTFDAALPENVVLSSSAGTVVQIGPATYDTNGTNY